MGSRLSLGHRHRLVEGQGGVIVHLPGAGAGPAQHPAVPVAGELIEAGVGAHDQGVPHLGAHGGDPPVEDALLGPGLGSGLVADGGHPEQVDAADAGLGAGGGLAAQGLQGVLDHTGHRLDRVGLADALAHEDRQDEAARVDDVLAGQAPHGRGGAQPPGPDRRRRGGRDAVAGQQDGGIGMGIGGGRGGAGRGGGGHGDPSWTAVVG